MKAAYLLVTLGLAFAAKAACPAISTYPNSPGWAKGAQITVYVVSADGGFSSNAQSSISTAFKNWAGLQNSGQSISTQSVTSLPATANKPYAVILRGQPSCGVSACTTFTASGANNATDTATITISPDMGDTGMEQLLAHEVGHSYGLKDCDGCSNTVMNPSTSSTSPTGPTSCDSAAVYNNNGQYGQGSSTACNCHCVTTGCCLPSCCDSASSKDSPSIHANRLVSSQLLGLAMAKREHPNNRCTPILVDLTGKGFKLTDTGSGVWFDIFANGTRTQIPWPAEGAANA